MRLPPILFEDDAMIAFAKPCGLPVAPERGEKTHAAGNLMSLVRAQMGPGVANVHRLDAETSGLLLCAKTKPALDFLSGQFQSKTVEKIYLALAVVLPLERAGADAPPLRAADGGLPAAFHVELALGVDEQQPARMRVFRRRGGKPSTTEFRVREAFGRFALLECRPLTGRRHQVRVHLAAAGAPVLNDALYGEPELKLLLSDLKRGYKGRDEEKPMIERLALHASAVTLTHPLTRERVTLTAPLPKDFEVPLKYLRKFGARR